MVRSPLNWQRMLRRNVTFTAGLFASIILQASAQLVLVETAIAVEPQGPAAATSANGRLGTGDALQLYRNCVFQAVVRACTQLIEQSRGSGGTTAYPVAAAHYKRGSINAENKRLEAALKDYKKAAALFPFPQLDLEIERLEKQLGKSRSTKRARPQASQPKKANAKKSNPSPPTNSRQLAANSGSVVRTVRPKPVTPNQRKFALPTVEPTKVAASKPTEPSKKTIEWPERAARNGTKTSELWETITERVIHRYRVKSPTRRQGQASKVLADLRGSCADETTGDCATLANEIEIESAEFSSGIQNQSDFEQIRRTAGRTYSNLTTGSLPSFQAMSGLSKSEEAETPNNVPDTRRAASVVTSEMTLPAKTVKISMIDRPVLVTPIPIGKPDWAPSPLQISLVLVLLSVSAGLFALYQRRPIYLTHLAKRLSFPIIPDSFTRVRSKERKQFDLTDTVASSGMQEGRSTAGTTSSAPPNLEPSLRTDNHWKTTDLAQEIANSLASAVKPPELQRPPPPLKPDSLYATRTASDPTHASRSEANLVSNRLDTQRFDGSVLIVASDDQKRQRLLQATLHAMSASKGELLRPLIALDSTGNLAKLLQDDERYNDALTIVDWKQSQFAGRLNPFAIVGVADDPLARVQTLSKTFEMQCHVCEGFLGSALVAQSRSQLRHLFRLMTITPGADLSTLRDLLNSRDASSYTQQIEDLGSKPMSSFFELEFSSRSFGKLAVKLLEKLDSLLSNDRIAAAVLEPKSSRTESNLSHDLRSITVVPVEQHNTSASSFMRRLCLAKAMHNGALSNTPLLPSDTTTLMVDSLSHFELPDVLEFNQILKDFMNQGGRIIAGVSNASELPDGNCELVARSCSGKVIDSSLTSQMHSISEQIGTSEHLLDVAMDDRSDDQALLLRSEEQGDKVVVVNY